MCLKLEQKEGQGNWQCSVQGHVSSEMPERLVFSSILFDIIFNGMEERK